MANFNMRFYLVFGLLALIHTCSFGQSTTSTTAKNITPHSQQQITATPPIVVKLITPPKSKAEMQEDELDRKEHAENERAITKYTWLLVVVGVLQFVVFLMHWRTFVSHEKWMERSVAEMESRNKIAENDAYITQRAFVTLKGFEERECIGDLTPIVLTPIWHNCGLTPTRVGRTMCKYIQTSPTGIPYNFEFPNDDMIVPILVGPGSTTGSTIYIEPTISDQLRKGTIRVFVYGSIEYADQFSRPESNHRTEFCYEVNLGIPVTRNINDTNIPRPLGFRLHSKHNGSDDECIHSYGKLSDIDLKH